MLKELAYASFPSAYRLEHLTKLCMNSLSAQVAASGLIVNSMGWVEDLGYQLLQHTIRALAIDVVLVVGAERLFHSLQQSLS